MKLLNTKQIFHRITNKNFIHTFQKIEKNESVLRRHTKISIFEYFFKIAFMIIFVVLLNLLGHHLKNELILQDSLVSFLYLSLLFLKVLCGMVGEGTFEF